jgi:hypothetical protein
MSVWVTQLDQDSRGDQGGGAPRPRGGASPTAAFELLRLLAPYLPYLLMAPGHFLHLWGLTHLWPDPSFCPRLLDLLRQLPPGTPSSGLSDCHPEGCTDGMDHTWRQKWSAHSGMGSSVFR